MKKSLQIAFSSMVTALSVVLMFLGGVFTVLTYIMPMISGVMMSLVKKTFGTSLAWVTYIATALLSVFLVPNRECMIMFVAFFGFYLIIKSGLDKIKLKPLCFVLKLLIFNALMSASQVALFYIFQIPFTDEETTTVFIILFAVLLNLMFIIYDKFLEKLLILYERKLEKRIKKLFK